MTTNLEELKKKTLKDKVSDILDNLMGKYISIHELKEKLENIGEEKCTYYIDYHYTKFSDGYLYVGETSIYTRYELGVDKLICKDFDVYMPLKRVIIEDTMLVLEVGPVVVIKR